MSTWACGHTVHVRTEEEAGLALLVECRACAAQARRNRRHWSALALAVVLLLLLLCAAVSR